MGAELPDDILQLRDRLRQLNSAPPQTSGELLRAQERMAVLESRLFRTADALESIRIEREIAGIAQGIAGEVRALSEQRRQHRRTVFSLRRELYDRLVPLHERLISEGTSRVRMLTIEALEELDRLEAHRSALVEQSIPVPVKDAHLPRLRRMLQGALRLLSDATDR